MTHHFSQAETDTESARSNAKSCFIKIWKKTYITVPFYNTCIRKVFLNEVIELFSITQFNLQLIVITFMLLTDFPQIAQMKFVYVIESCVSMSNLK